MLPNTNRLMSGTPGWMSQSIDVMVGMRAAWFGDQSARTLPEGHAESKQTRFGASAPAHRTAEPVPPPTPSRPPIRISGCPGFSGRAADAPVAFFSSAGLIKALSLPRAIGQDAACP